MDDIDEIKALVKLAKNSDKQAFGQLYDIFAGRIFKYIRIKVQNKEQAEDILQDVFVKAYKGLNNLSLEELNFSAWLYRIAGNTINDFFRKKYRTPEIVAIDESFDMAGKVDIEKEAQVNMEIDFLQKAFNELPALYRQVLELRFVQGFSLDEVARVVKKSNLAVRLLQFRALKKVQGILKDKNVQDR